MSAIVVQDVSFSFARTEALERISLTVPEGALYALIGPNGAGKSTLLHILMGLRRDYQGSATILGRACKALRAEDRRLIGYVAEAQKLPGWMRLEQLEAYLAPWYPTWDFALAKELRNRFELDATQKLARFSRGQYMKAALLCALAPRPKMLLMDEPFTGMDVAVKDDLVRGLLSASASDGCTIVLSSHDIGEIELLADWVGFLQNGRLKMSESMDSVRARFKHVDVILSDDAIDERPMPTGWMAVQRAGRRVEFVVSDVHGEVEQVVRARFAGVARVESRQATLKELFMAMQRSYKLSGSAHLNSETAS